MLVRLWSDSRRDIDVRVWEADAMQQVTDRHTHQTHADPGQDTEPATCVVCGIEAPRPCSWGEQCGNYQREVADWSREMSGRSGGEH